MINRETLLKLDEKLDEFGQKYAKLQDEVKNSAIGLYDTMLKIAQLSGLTKNNVSESY